MGVMSLVRSKVRRIAMETGRYRRLYVRLCSPMGAEYAEFVRRHGGLVSVGEHCSILPSTKFTDPELVRLGNNVHFSECTLIGHDGSIAMLNRAYNVKLDSVGKIDIRDNVFVGYGAIIMPNVTIGPNAIVAAGAVVIDNSSHFRYDSDVPLIVPEVNADAIAGFRKRGIIANPNCSTAQLVVALKPLHDRAKIKRVVVATYQSVSGAGKDAMDELFSQTKSVFQLDDVEAKKFPKRIAFNLIPQIDVFMEDGYTKEEWKMVVETKKILDPKIKLTATCVRVPVFIGHSEAVNLEFEKPITADEAREVLRNAPGCIVIDKHEPGGYVTPYESAGEDATFISRIREDATVENGLSMWIVSDNLRKGAALNAIQIAEALINRKLITAKRRAA